MNKKLLGLLGFTSLSLTGCGFVIQDEALEIAGIASTVLEDGQTMVVITYTDEEVAPTVFYLPKGEDGEDGKNGTGIASFDYKEDNYGNYDVTIKFTDESVEDVKLKLTNGVSISTITTQENSETGQTEMVIFYSDGTKSDPLVLPKGDKGEDGKGIESYSYLLNEETGGYTLSFTFTDGNNFDCEIPKPEKGDDGKGIAAIVSSQTETEYVLIISYTDNSTPQVVRFDKPSTWLFGTTAPNDINDGKNGDFYYDTSKNTIYLKKDGTWVIQTDFSDVDTKYVVSFNLNASDAIFLPGFGYDSSYIFTNGDTFYSTQRSVPIPYRNGYTFVGWYTSATPSVTHGSFNDLTPVISDMTLYAAWEKTE